MQRTSKTTAIHEIERLVGKLSAYDRRELQRMTLLQLFVVGRLIRTPLDSAALKHARRVIRILGSAEPASRRSTRRATR